MYKTPHKSIQLDFLWNGSSQWEQTVVGSEYFDGKLFKIPLIKFSNSYLAPLKESSGETHTGREESAWLGSGYYYEQMLLCRNICKHFGTNNRNCYINMYDEWLG